MGDRTAASAATQPRGGDGFVDRTFRSLRVRNFRLFIIGQGLSGVGTWMQWVAAPWLVLQLTDSGVALGVDAALGALPILLFGAWGGVLADRFDNRRILLWTQSLYALLAFALFALDATGVVQVWQVFVLSFLTGIVGAVDMPTRQSFYVEMVGPEDLTNAMSLNTATFTGSRIVGPVIAGIMVARVGTAPVFLVNGVTYLAVIVALLAMHASEMHPRERVARAKGQIREGIRHVRETAALRRAMVVMAVVFTFTFNFSVLMPLLAVDTFESGEGAFSALLALSGVGSLVGALLMAGRSAGANVRLVALLALGFGASSVLIAVTPALSLAFLVAPLLGGVAIAFAITGNATLQLNSAPELRGRVMAIYTVVFIGSTAIGSPIAGAVGEYQGPQVAFAAGGVLAVLVGLWALRVLRQDRPALVPAVSHADPG